jgi:hypothetical protein
MSDQNFCLNVSIFRAVVVDINICVLIRRARQTWQENICKILGSMKKYKLSLFEIVQINFKLDLNV